MEPFVSNRQEMTWLSFYPPNDAASKWEKRTYFLCFSIVLSTFIGAFIGSVVFLEKFMLRDLNETFYVLFQVAVSAITIYLTINGFLSRHKNASLFNGLADLYKKCKKN